MEKNIWGTITTESFTPFIELDFVGGDVFELVLRKGPEEVRAYYQSSCAAPL